MKLDELVAPMSPAAFIETLSAGNRVIFIPGDPGKFEFLFDASEFWDCARASKPDGASLPRASMTSYQIPLAFEEGAIRRALKSGNTVCVSHIDRTSDRLRRLCLNVESALGFPGSSCVHCYISPPGTGYDFFHVDSGFAVTLQLTGTKNWAYNETPAIPWCSRVGGFREPGRLEWFGESDWHPAAEDLGLPHDQEIIERTLHPGDLLVMPPGTWHRVQATNELSISLNLKLTHTSSIDSVLQILRHQCLGEVNYRKPLPFATNEDLLSGMVSEAAGNAIAEQLRDLSRTLAALAADPAAISMLWFRNFLGSQNNVVGDHVPEMTSDSVFEIPEQTSPRIAVLHDDSATLLAQGKILRVRGIGVAPLLRRILACRRFMTREVDSWPEARALGYEQTQAVLMRLAQSGFLRIVT